MKHAKNILLILMLVFPIFLMAYAVPVPTGMIETPQATPSETMALSYVEYHSISITSDNMFQDLAENESWSGDGSESTPFLIENYNISLDTTCIYIAQVTFWFEIQGCYLSRNSTSQSGLGIQLFNCTHAKIVDTTVIDKEYGIIGTFCPDLVVDNCIVTNIAQIGLMISHSDSATVTNTDISHTGYFGIHIDYSRDALIQYSSFFETMFFGIRLTSANRTMISSSQIYSNLYDGIYMDNSYDVQVLGCELWDNGGGDCEITVYHCPNVYIFSNLIANNTFGTGLEIQYSDHATVTDNVVVGNSNFGIGIYYSDYSTILRNTIYDNANSGIYIQYSNWCDIEDNTIYNNMFFSGPIIVMCGIELEGANHTSILHNEIYHNALNGISVLHSDDIEINENFVYDNADHGINIMNSTNGVIQNNTIHGNGYWPVYVNSLCGIFVDESADWLITGNQIWNNTPSGISIESSFSGIDIIDNDIFNNTDMGIYLAYTTDISIIENTIYHNGWNDSSDNPSGILLDSAYYTLVQSNEVFNNYGHGIQSWSENCSIIGNFIYGNTEVGLASYETYDNIYSENIVHDNGVGIYIVNIGSNVTDNIVYDNDLGILMEWSGECWIYGNDFGWNDINAIENFTFNGRPLMWYNNVTHVGNHWQDYSGTGAYDIGNGSGIVNSDIYPQKSLALEAADSIEFEITSTGNTMLWPAHALNPSHYELYVDGYLIWYVDWNGEDIEFSVDGLIAGTHTLTLRVYHYSGHWINASTTVTVVDETPPDWVEIPPDITIYENEQLYYVVNVTDPSGIGGYSTNSTLHFTISNYGILTNLTKLTPGVYGVSIIVWDTYDNFVYHVIRVTVLEVPTTTTTTSTNPTVPYDPTPLVIGIIAAGGAVVILVVAILLYKRKK